MSEPRPVVVLVAGDPVPRVLERRGGFSKLIREAAGTSWAGPYRDVDLRTGEALPDPRDVSGIVVTGSASSITERAPWMLRGEEYLRVLVAKDVPTFGICFGHQMLGAALGGEVARNSRGREIGTVDLEVIGPDEIVDGLPAPLRANTTHLDTVQRLPSGAIVLARTERDPHAAVRFARNAWGVQFHPEMDAEVVRGYVESRRDVLSSEGFAPDELLKAADDALAGKTTLTRFFERLSSR